MFFLILAGIIIIDQVTKYFAYVYLQPQSVIPVINNVFYLNYVENRGAAFGILQNRVWFLAVITVIIIAAAGYYIYKNPQLTVITKYSIALIMGGAIGNLIDRVRIGYVIDFFDFVIWPVFNVADMSVVVGTIILVFILLFDKNVARS
jgi:signal peptidase II